MNYHQKTLRKSDLHGFHSGSKCFRLRIVGFSEAGIISGVQGNGPLIWEDGSSMSTVNHQD